jgi:hypothetical protein
MTETTAKFKLPRKAIRVTYAHGADGTFDSIKAASEETGHSHSMLMRLAATGEADANGDKYALIDYVPKAKKSVNVSFDEDWYADLVAACERRGQKPSDFIRGAVQDALKLA